MPAGSLLALLDDIGSVLDDVAVLTKLATRKTAGVLGDDLALNAEQVAGVSADRELPVVWAVAKGSLVNKAILVPSALLISALAPWAITPLLMVGGSYLCFEGFEKVLHALHPPEKPAMARRVRQALLTDMSAAEIAALEREKVRGAVRTDFVLSAEIVTIALGSVASAPFLTQILVLVSLAFLMTLGVYGLVAAIVKLDDLGVYLCNRASVGAPSRASRLQRSVGNAIVGFAPWIMKSLTVVGTAAMFLVGGGILVHGIVWTSTLTHHVEVALHGAGSLVAGSASVAISGVSGLVAGALVWAIVVGTRRAFTAKR